MHRRGFELSRFKQEHVGSLAYLDAAEAIFHACGLRAAVGRHLQGLWCGDAGCVTGESTPGVNKNQSKEQQAVAQDFIKYLLANDDYIREAVSELNSFPAKTSLQNDKDILSKPVMAAIQPRVDRLIWPGPAPSTVESSGTTAFQNVFQNGMSIDKALKEAQGQMDTDMKSSDFTSMESKYAYFDEHK